MQHGEGDKGAYREDRVQGAFAVVSLVALTFVSSGMGPPSGLPQPPLDLSPRTAMVASHAEEVAMDCSPPGSSVHGISQTRILEWGAVAFTYLTSMPQNSNGCQKQGKSEKL